MMSRLSGMALCLLIATVGAATAAPDKTPAEEAAAHNAAFVAATKSGLSPQTTDERLLCAAIWNRWHYAVESAASPAFVAGLSKQLSAERAAERESHWRKQATARLNSPEAVVRLGKDEAEAQAKADALYADYANNAPRGFGKLMEYLGFCQ